MAAKMKPCLCRSYEFGNTVEVGDQPEFDGYGTGCRQSTTKTFAQGHDAKLVGFLVRAELAGEEIRVNTGGVVSTWGKAVAAALWISEALALKAQAQMDAAKARVAKAGAREAAKAARKSAKAAAEPVAETPKPTTRKAWIKVGRWAYEATIDLASGVATYRTRLGATHKVDAGTYKEV